MQHYAAWQINTFSQELVGYIYIRTTKNEYIFGDL